jgi:hypothetical protein
LCGIRKLLLVHLLREPPTQGHIASVVGQTLDSL